MVWYNNKESDELLGVGLARINKLLGERSEAEKAYEAQCWERFEAGEITAAQRDAYIMDGAMESDDDEEEENSFDHLYEQAARL